MRSSFRQFDAWLDNELRAVALPRGMTARLARIPRQAAGTNGGGQSANSSHWHRPTAGNTASRQADLAPRPVRFARGAFAAVLFLGIATVYSASLSAFLCTSHASTQQAERADDHRIIDIVFLASDEFEGSSLRFLRGDAPSESTACRAIANAVRDPANRPLAVTFSAGASVDSEPAEFASASATDAIFEFRDRTSRRGRGFGSHRRQRHTEWRRLLLLSQTLHNKSVDPDGESQNVQAEDEFDDDSPGPSRIHSDLWPRWIEFWKSLRELSAEQARKKE
jgi:hypothetical protein